MSLNSVPNYVAAVDVICPYKKSVSTDGPVKANVFLITLKQVAAQFSVIVGCVQLLYSIASLRL
jgi:hypothetical protein